MSRLLKFMYFIIFGVISLPCMIIAELMTKEASKYYIGNYVPFAEVLLFVMFFVEILLGIYVLKAVFKFVKYFINKYKA